MAAPSTQYPILRPAVVERGWPVVVLAAAGAICAGAAMALSPRLGIGVTLALLTLPLVLIDLPVGIALWVPLVFLERLPQTSVAPTLVGILIAVAWIGLLAVRAPAVAEVLRRDRLLFGSLALLVTWITLSVSWAPDPAAAGGEFWLWCVAGATLLVLATSLTRESHLRMLCGAIVVGALLAAAASAVIDPVATVELAAQDAGRLGAGLGDPNFLAAGLVPAIALAVGLAAGARPGPRRWLLIAAIASLAIGLIATGSRGGLIGAGVAAVVAVMIVRRHRLQIVAVALAVAVVAAGTLATTSSDTWDRIREFDTSGTGRVDLWAVAAEMGADHPVGGVGVNNFRGESGAYVREPGSFESPELVLETPHVVHSVPLQQFAETGLVGLILLLLVVAASLGSSWRAIGTFERQGRARLVALAQSVLVAQVGILVCSGFLSNGHDKRLWILLALGPVALTVARAHVQGERG